MNVRTLSVLLLTIFLLPGCDWIAEKAGIDKVDASLGSVGANLAVTPNGASSNSGTVNVGSKDLPDVFDVESITIDKSNVTYTAIAGKAGNVEASGSVDVFIIIEQAPAFGLRATITDNVLTDISPTTINIGSYNKTTFGTCLERFDAGEQPALRSNYQSLSQSQIADIVNDAIKHGNFSVSIMACTNGDLTGLLSFTKLTFNLDF